MIDTAFFDRFHHYLPGWEIPKMRPEYFTDAFGFISDYFSECLRVFPDGSYQKEDVRKCLEYALIGRRRIKEQLKKIGGLEFFDVHFSYIDLEDGEESYVSTPENVGSALIPEGEMQAGSLYGRECR